MLQFHLSSGEPSALASRLALRLRRRQTGLTLVELLIALALLGFVFLGIAPLFIASVKSNYSANEYTSVNMLARDKLEELENLPLSDLDLAEGSHPNDLPLFVQDPLMQQTPSVPNPYTRTWQITDYHLPVTSQVTPPFVSTPVTPPAPYDYKQIDVTVITAEGHLGIGSRRAMITGYVQNPNFTGPTPTPGP